MTAGHEIDPEKNPLSFLDRLLEEERDSNLHFGDIRFWRHLEFIDTKQIFRIKSLEYRTMKLMFCEALFYLIFLTVLTLYIITLRSPDVFDSQRQQFEYWAGCNNRPAPTDSVYVTEGCSFFDVKDVQGISPYIRETFAPKAFTAKDEFPKLVESPSIFRLSEGTTSWSPRYVGDTDITVLIGAIRIRQLRVQRVIALDCPMLEELKDLQPDCFPAYSVGLESKRSWAPTWTPDHLRVHYEHSKGNLTDQTEFKGFHASYPASGFMLDLPYNISGAQTRLLELENWAWVDHRTRAVIVEWSTLNANVNVFVHNRMLFEVPPTGGVTTRYEVFAFRVLQLSMSLLFSDDRTLFLLMCFTSACHLLLFIYSCFLVWQNGMAYFKYFWTLLDAAILILFVILMSVNTAVFMKAANQPNLVPEVIGDPEMFFPIGKLVPDLELSTDILAILGLLAWIKILKYFTLISMFQPFVRVFERCVTQLILFAGLLFIVLFGFAVAFYAGFGGETDLFSTLSGSFIACIVAPAGGVNFGTILESGEFLGALLVFLYVMIIVFLLVTTFMAIVVDSYSCVTYQILETRRLNRGDPSLTFLWTYYNALRNVKLVGKETEEDKGKHSEQQIALTSLPQAIQDRYIDQKRKMEAMMDGAKAEIENTKMEKLRAQGKLDPDEWDEPASPGTTGNMALEGPRMLAIDDMQPPQPPSGTQAPENTGWDEEEEMNLMVSRVQLQRMLDEDEILRHICDTDRAIDIIRQFRVDQSDVDPYEAVAKLQASVAKKLEELKNGPGNSLSFDELETLRTVSSELHNALTESQKEWRSELLSVMQMASLLSKALVDLTRQLAQVQSYHNDLTTKVSR